MKLLLNAHPQSGIQHINVIPQIPSSLSFNFASSIIPHDDLHHCHNLKARSDVSYYIWDAKKDVPGWQEKFSEPVGLILPWCVIFFQWKKTFQISTATDLTRPALTDRLPTNYSKNSYS